MSNKYYDPQNLPNGTVNVVLKGSEPSETKIPNKKQTVYLVCGKRSDLRVETAKGYVIELTNFKGFTTQIALLCKGKSWYATHYETGVNCTPTTKATGEIEIHWKRDDLIARLKDVDFERCLFDRNGNKVFQNCIDMIEEYKRSVQDQ